jgi:hypothetical protein
MTRRDRLIFVRLFLFLSHSSSQSETSEHTFSPNPHLLTVLANTPVCIPLNIPLPIPLHIPLLHHIRFLRHPLTLHISDHTLRRLLHPPSNLHLLNLPLNLPLHPINSLRHSPLLLPPNITMPQIPLGIDLIADELLEDFCLGEAGFCLAVPEEDFLYLRLGVAAVGGGGGGDVCLREPV